MRVLLDALRDETRPIIFGRRLQHAHLRSRLAVALARSARASLLTWSEPRARAPAAVPRSRPRPRAAVRRARGARLRMGTLRRSRADPAAPLRPPRRSCARCHRSCVAERATRAGVGRGRGRSGSIGSRDAAGKAARGFTVQGLHGPARRPTTRRSSPSSGSLGRISTATHAALLHPDDPMPAPARNTLAIIGAGPSASKPLWPASRQASTCTSSSAAMPALTFGHGVTSPCSRRGG